MIRRQLCVGLALAALVQVCAGCAFRSVQLDPSQPVHYDPTRSRDIAGKACGFMLYGFIPIALSSRDGRAFRALTEQAHGDYFADVEAEQHMSYAFVGWTICTEFHAVAYARL